MNKRVLTIVFLASLLAAPASVRSTKDGEVNPPKGAISVRQCLSDPSFEFSGMAKLFRQEGDVVPELVSALDDSDERVAGRAQIMLRLIGDEEGVRRLLAWYEQRRAVLRTVNGPVQTPLQEWDYKQIADMLQARPSSKWKENPINSLFALAIDHSPRAQSFFAQMIDAIPARDDLTPLFQFATYVRDRPQEAAACEPGDPLEFVTRNAFFMPAEEKGSSALEQISSATGGRLLLVRVSRAFGNTFLVVLRRPSDCWRYQSVALYSVNN
jgi:hypothetical protein